MLRAAWVWLRGSRVSGWIAAAVVALAVLWAKARAIYRKGRKDERVEHHVEDLEEAQRIREAADAARRAGAVDDRDVDERLRAHGRLRDY